MGKQVVVLSEVLAGSEAVQASEVRTNPRASQKAAAGQD
jgi:hypothetical protein